MIGRRWLLALLLIASTSVHATDSVRVTGSGLSKDEAVANGFQKAIEVVSGIVVLSDREARNRKLTKEEILNYSAGYVDKFEIVNESKDRSGVYVEMDVWVRSSKLAEHKLNSGKDLQNIDGTTLGAQYQTYLNERNQADALFRKIIGDYPRNALEIKQIESSISVDDYRNAKISILAEVQWNQRYFASLKELISTVQEDKTYNLQCLCYVSKERFVVVNKDYSKDTFYLRDQQLSNIVRNGLTLPPKIYATIFDLENNILSQQCFWTEFKPMAVITTHHGNINEIYGPKKEHIRVNIPLMADSYLGKNITKISRVELSLAANCQ
jgi:hypothetical protein